MQENTNRAIAYNSLILYVRMFLTSICTLFTTRFSLLALGIVDYGLYALLGGVIAFVTILNNIMVTTSNRFIAVAIGRGNVLEANKQFNVSLVLHIGIALFVLAIAYPVGSWYIHRFVNYDGPISNAMMVYCISIAGSIVSFISVPYHGLLMAKEKFFIFSCVEVIIHIAKLLVTVLLLHCFSEKLLIYSLAFSILSASPTFYYMYYCSRHYPSIVRFTRVRERELYRKVFNFSSWIGLGAIAHAGKVHGSAILVNSFFNTVMNSAMGVASSLNSFVSLFALNIIQPMAPQINKSYALGNKKRSDELLIMSTKFGYLFTFFVGAIFLSAPDWIMKVWLKDVPQYATIFLFLFIVDTLVQSLNSGIQNIIFASGKVRIYQLSTSLLNVLSLILGFLVLKAGAPAYYLIVAYIMVSIIRFFVLQWVLHYTLNYDNKILWKQSYQPSLIVTILFIPALFIPDFFHPVIKMLVSTVYLCVLVCLIGLSRQERDKIIAFLRGIIHKNG